MVVDIISCILKKYLTKISSIVYNLYSKDKFYYHIYYPVKIVTKNHDKYF
jgi:hypothetical protein